MADVQIIVHDVPEAIREAVARECVDRQMSLTGIVGWVLAGRCGFEWDSTGYPLRDGTTFSLPWVIRVPVELRECLRSHARESGSAQGRLVAAILAEHYDLPIPSTRDRRGRSQPRDTSGRFITKEER